MGSEGIRFADGSTAELALIYGQQILDCWWNFNQPRDARAAVTAEGPSLVDAATMQT